MGKSGRKENSRGFTLMETLTVAGILAVLAAVVLVSVTAVQSRLHMAELDAYARQLFLAAQGEVTAMKADGRLVRFAETFGDGDALAEPPADYPKEEGGVQTDTRWMGLSHLSSDDPRAQAYLLRANDSLNTATAGGGCFLLELDPASGDIYSVFYREAPFTYDDVLAVCAASRTQAVRAEAALGYYGGSVGKSPTVGTPEVFSPEITVHNGEELWVEVSCGGLMPLRATQKDLTLTVTVEDEQGNAWKREFRGGRPASADGFFVNGDSVAVTVLLDSLEEGKHFAELTRAGDLTPGDDLSVSAEMVYTPKSHEDRIDSGAGARKIVNSLFGEKTETEDGTALRVSRVRHLNNLRRDICGTRIPAGTEIVQGGDIDFSFRSWTKGEDYLTLTDNPLAKAGFSPIKNDVLFARGTVYDGGGGTISGFTVRGGDYAGLFASARDCTFRGMRLVDHAVSGTRNVGALAGYLVDCQVLDCGVYLDTGTTAYPTDLPARTVRCTVFGSGSTVGGLVGLGQGECRIVDSFAAVGVSGGGYVGGLAGYLSGKAAVSGCYASGAVKTAGYVAGGLVGAGEGAELSDCYAAGDVTAAGYAGGLLGQSVGGKAVRCRSYGRVLDDGAGDELGGFVGANDRTSYSNCAYLKQVKYNEDLGAQPGGVTAAGYETLRSSPANPGGVSFPYSLELWGGEAFPFPLLKKTAEPGDVRMPHYGDWPTEYQMKTSLVYYEKYRTADADGGFYGYYADVSLTTGGGETDGGWTVDTLRDEVCVEDGYAVLSTYALTRFDYTLDPGTGAGAGAKATLTVTDTLGGTAQERAGQALRLTDGVHLTFTKGSGSVTITNAKVYQLPFALQVTDRFAAKTFWETLTLQDGYVGGHRVFTSYTFYYCPDFAKNAVNPAEEGKIPAKPAEPAALYVRSARQLNGLGRSTYYWNTTAAGNLLDVTFLQETDVDFGLYTGGTGRYCGEVYDLMDTSRGNPYRNKPIGRTNNQAGKNFRNTYDGRGNRIVDYCCETYAEDDYQFTGLFGEVQNGLLTNIVMTASDPEGGSAYIRSHYNGSLHPGTAPLAGLLYVDKGGNQAALDKNPATARNCAVSGYTVRYDNASGNSKSATGGLAGFCFGVIENCSAVNREVAAFSRNERFVGGLVGSLNGKGAVRNCYAGGSVLSASGNGTNYLGGIRGGFDNIYGAYDDASGMSGQRSQSITGSYAYCVWDREHLGTNSFAPVSRPANVAIQNCYYLTDAVDADVRGQIVSADGAKGLSGAELAGLTALPDRASAGNSHPWSAALLGAAYPFPAAVADPDSGDFVHYGDWPARNGGLELTADTYLVYYERYTDGKWGVYTLDEAGSPISSLDAEDQKEISRTGYGILTKNDSFKLQVAEYGAVSGGQAAKEKLTASIQSGYGLYALSDLVSGRIDAVNRYGVRAAVELQDTNGKTRQTLYLYTPMAAGIFSERDGSVYQFRTADQLQSAQGKNGWTFVQTHDIVISKDGADRYGMLNNNAGGSDYDGGGHTISGLTRPLFHQNDGRLHDLHLLDVDIDSREQSVAALVVDGNRAGSVISECTVEGSVKTSALNGTAAGLAVVSGGSVSGCRVECAVEGAQAAGFVHTTTGGSIRRCGASVIVDASDGAAGFVYLHNGGFISGCYAEGSVDADATAAGFFCNGWGRTEDCYTTARVYAGSAYGFGPPGRDAKNSWYTADTGRNGSGNWCRGVDWAAAVDEKGVPKEDWSDHVKIF